MNQRTLSFILLFSITLMLLSSLSSVEARGYSINQADLDLYVQPNGLLHVNETYYYSFTGIYHGIYRDIPLKSGQKIQNMKINTKGAYSSYEIINDGNVKKIRVYLYSDAEKTKPIDSRNVQITIAYDFANVINIYNDVGELHYKLWGEYWNRDVGKVNVQIHFPSGDITHYWISPQYYVKNSYWSNSSLFIESTTIPSGKYLEVRVAIPLSQFKNPVYAKKINGKGLYYMEEIQKNYQNEIDFQNNLYITATILMMLSMLIPVFIYLKYGREPKIQYSAPYEHEIPSKDPPAVINAIFGKNYGIGEPDMNGFRATIMDLINRGYLKVVAKSSENEEKKLLLKTTKKKFVGLHNYEKDALHLLTKFKSKGVINLEKMSKDMKDSETADSVFKLYNSWSDDLKSDFLSEELVKEYFNDDGNQYLKLYGVFGIFISIGILIMSLWSPLSAATYTIYASIILILASIISCFIPSKIAGRWTEYGMECDAKWKNFKKYLEDFSLIKEHPPESVVIWNQYLVYAAALGVVPKVQEAMNIYLEDHEVYGSDLYLFYYYGGYEQLSSSLYTGISNSVPDSSSGGSGGGMGGVGGVGGGSGGGGGGAF